MLNETLNTKCRICDKTNDNTVYNVKEMMFGTKEVFEYIQCKSCECLQIIEYPNNISRFYPDNYYSLETDLGGLRDVIKEKNSIKKYAIYLRNKNNYFKSNIFTKIVTKYLPRDYLDIGARESEMLINMAAIGVREDARILDVGCGAGQLMSKMKHIGYRNVEGVDPFIAQTITYPNGIQIHKCEVHELNSNYDFIMMHHSLEHMPYQRNTLHNVSKLLVDGGMLLVRIPTVSSHVWERYRQYWVELDAPRHFYLHSLKSIEILCHQVGFKILDMYCDSTEFELWGSEQYCKDIPLNSEISHDVNPEKSIFSDEDISRYQDQVKTLNYEKRGGRAAFYFKKARS